MTGFIHFPETNKFTIIFPTELFTVDRLIDAVTEISKQEKVDVFMIDDTRTQGDKTSFNNMFEAIERIKNAYLVSTPYGRYPEAM